MHLGQLTIEEVPIEALRVRSNNPRLHSRKQINQIARSIRRFGFTNPLLIDEKGVLIAGHGRLEAAQMLRIEILPVIRMTGLSEAAKNALMVADNRIGETSQWDHSRLRDVLQDLVDLDFGVEDIGFDTADVDLILGHDGNGAIVVDADEEVTPEPGQVPVSRPGDLYRLGKHVLLCADAREAQSYARLLGSEPAGMVFTDPPYNVPVAGHVKSRDAKGHREFAMASGEMTSAEFTDFLKQVVAQLAAHSKDGAIHFICMDWRHLYELLTAAIDCLTFKNLCVWAKDNGGLGSLYRSQHELVVVFKSGTAPHTNNVELGRKGRYRTNVWRYPGGNSFRPGRQADLKDHPTVKPVAMVADAILDCSKTGEVVLDPFAGSGTTIVACERTRRRAACMEINPLYVDVAIKRFQQRTGIAAIHADTGLTFEALGCTRHGDGGGWS